MKNIQLSGPIMILVAASLWGTTGTAQTLTPSSSSPAGIAALRMLIAGLAMLFMCRATLFKPAHWPWGKTILAGLSIAIYQVSSFSAMAITGVAIGTMIAMGTAPIFAGILELLIKKKKPVSIWYLSTFLALIGCSLILLPSNNFQLNSSGIILATIAGLFYACYSLLISIFVEKHPPQIVTPIVTCTAALMLLPILFNTNLNWLLSPNGWLIMIYLGLVATAFSYWIFAKGLETVQISTGVTLTLAEPLVATILGLFFIGEQLSVTMLSGIVCMFSALVLLMRPQQIRN